MPPSVWEWIDYAVLGFFTRWSHRFQRWTGLTSYFLAAIGAAAMLVSVVTASTLFAYVVLLPESTFTTAGAVLAVIFALFLIFWFAVGVNGIAVCLRAAWEVSGRRGKRAINLLKKLTHRAPRLLSVVYSFSALGALTRVTRLFADHPEIRLRVPALVVYAIFCAGAVGFTIFEYCVMVEPLPSDASAKP